MKNESNSNEPEFIEGRLYFNTSEQLSNTINGLKKLGVSALQKKMSKFYKKGFKPLKPFFDETNYELIQEYANKKVQNFKNSENEELDDEDNLIGDDFFAALLNENREIQVGDTIYKYTETGLYFCSIDYIDEMYQYLEELEYKRNLKNIAPIDPCGLETKEYGTQPVNAYVMRFIPEPDCGGTIGGGGGNTGGSTGGINGDDFINGLPVCEERKGFWNILGTVRICEDYYDKKHRVKTKYWKQKYLIFGASIGVSVKYQQRTAGIFWTTKTEEIRLGLKQIYFEYEMPVPNIQNTLPILIAYQGKFYDSNMHILKVLNGQPQLPQMPFQDEYNIVNLWINLPFFGYQNVNVTSAQMNKLFWDKAWGFAKDLGKKLGKPTPKKINMIGFTSQKAIINYVNLENINYNKGKITNIFDWNGQITFKWTTDVTNGGFNWSWPSVKSLYDYKNVKIDIYGVAKNGSIWKGSRLIYEDSK
ncbi:MAG: hypothetical protein L3J74_01760 [Bacteroidales bacterium]|nr:hypothetical protein [Bacteroidales bacterium]